ncbi:M28 family peptidase [Bacteroidota bacterium]
MNYRNLFISFFLSLITLISYSQNSKFGFSNDEVETRIKRDIYVLSADSFLGREAGTRGEIIARDYLNNQFENSGLSTFKGFVNYQQEFAFEKESEFKLPNSIIIDGEKLKLNSDYYPVSLSGSGEGEGSIIDVGYGISAPEFEHDDYIKLSDIKGKIFVMDVSLPGGYKKESKFLKYSELQKRIDHAIVLGAKAIFLKNTDKKLNFFPDTAISIGIIPNTIPIIYLTEKGLQTLNKKGNSKVSFYISNSRKKYKGYNIVGRINNNSERTIVIGAHYDHLGTGGGLSRYKGDPSIHNGADDNASGVAAVIEVARFISAQKDLTANYIFAAFSAEEKGLLGSNHLVKSDELDIEKVICMINFDMLGRVDSASKNLTIMGVGTSTIWDTLLTNPKDGSLQIVKSKSGVAGSDQLPFYLADKPVLFFFTGIHSDYHNPTDDFEKLNFSGEVDIIRYTENLILKLDKLNEIAFVKASGSEENKPSRYKGPTLGVVPDHGYAGKGMGISEVMDDRPAFNAGIQKGDIILKISDYDVENIRGYMGALSHFKKGDKVIVKIQRGEQIIEKDVEL